MAGGPGIFCAPPRGRSIDSRAFGCKTVRRYRRRAGRSETKVAVKWVLDFVNFSREVRAQLRMLLLATALSGSLPEVVPGGVLSASVVGSYAS